MRSGAPGTKPQRDALRRKMEEQGCTPDQIASEMAQRWGYRPRQAWRHAYGWTQDEVANRYNKLLDDSRASMTGKRISDYEAWPNGGVKPTLSALSVLANIYSTVTRSLVDLADRDAMTRHELIAIDMSDGTATTKLDTVTSDKLSGTPEFSKNSISPYRPRPSIEIQAAPIEVPGIESPFNALRDLVVAAAYQSRDHAENAQGSGMSEATLEDVTVDVERLVKEHLYVEPFRLFPETVQARDRIYRLLERRQYPGQAVHLYYLAAIICALLADTSANVGLPNAALEQTRASWAYAEIIGHNSLRLWCRTMQASIAYWSGRPKSALELANSATEWATEATGQIYVHNAVALFSALTDRKSEARASLSAAFAAQETTAQRSELFDRLGGMFSYSRAKLLQVSSITYLELGEYDRAESQTSEAVSLYEQGPVELRAYGCEASARIDLAQARLLKGDVEGTESALRTVLDTPQPQRLDWVVKRIEEFHTRLRNHTTAGSALSRQLAAEIEDFCEATAADQFPGLDR